MSAPQQEIRFQKEIADFEAKDKRRPQPRGIILFTGSSIFRFWTSLERDMYPLPVLNRAFGGARTWEVLHYMDRIVLPYKPKTIAYYCGSNDINFGASTEDIFRCFKKFADRAHEVLPKTNIFFVSIIKAPQKKDVWDAIDTANDKIKTYCNPAAGLGFIDVNPSFFTSQNHSRGELYMDDGLHFKPEAYREMARIVKPVLERSWQEAKDGTAEE
ncbi:MAG: GDSL-type esterase/lipase family protein [Pseudomonadota bacterium]